MSKCPTAAARGGRNNDVRSSGESKCQLVQRGRNHFYSLTLTHPGEEKHQMLEIEWVRRRSGRVYLFNHENMKVFFLFSCAGSCSSQSWCGCGGVQQSPHLLWSQRLKLCCSERSLMMDQCKAWARKDQQILTRYTCVCAPRLPLSAADVAL